MPKNYIDSNKETHVFLAHTLVSSVKYCEVNLKWRRTFKGLEKPNGTKVRVVTTEDQLKGLRRAVFYKGPFLSFIGKSSDSYFRMINAAHTLIDTGRARWAKSNEKR